MKIILNSIFYRQVILEFSQHPLLVQLMSAVLDVDFEMFGGVFQEDITDLSDEDVLLPTLLQISQQSFGTFSHRNNIREQGVAFQFGE